MFEKVAAAPPDPILGLTEAFKKDNRPGKINLAVGVYKDASGATPVLGAVKEAEKRLLEQEKTKGYKPIDGDPEYGKIVRSLLFGAGSELVEGGRAVTCHTPGGTGALRLAGDFLKNKVGADKIWMSDPTWANHPGVFSEVGLSMEKYRYFDPDTNSLDFEGMKQSLQAVRPGQAVLLHACCHNPSGVDPTLDQWKELSVLLKEKGALPVVDFAYQGFGTGIEQDAAGLRILAAEHDELLVCSSFSKNFGLYNERTGALTLEGRNADQTAASLSQLKICARRNYSNPPAHGGAIVTTIMSDPDLRAEWEEELSGMRERIVSMRASFVAGLQAAGASRDFSFITHQNGMFSFSGLNKEQVEELRAKHAIYIVGSGRLNVAGMNEDTMQTLCEAVVSVL